LGLGSGGTDGVYLPAEVVGDDLVFVCGHAVEGE
jgi:hypothetical protein